MSTAIQFENISKQYRLGEVGTGTLSHDLHRAWAKLRGKPDPFSKVGATNNREEAGGEYVWALKDINFSIQQGEILGIIGRNGAGKSTLLKLLSRVTAPTTGTIKAKGRIASLLEVGTGFHPELTGRENIYLNGAIMGMTRHEITTRLEEIVEFSGCAKYIDTPVKRYSSGMTVRLGFSVAAHLDCEILVVDEVLAVGDAEFRKRCVGKMGDIRETGRTVIFVSHSMESVIALCNRAATMEQGTVVELGDAEAMVDSYLQTNFRSLTSTTMPQQISNDIELKSVEIGPRPTRTGDQVSIAVEIRALQQTHITEAAFVIQTVEGRRIAVLDLRQDGRTIELAATEQYCFSAKIQSLTLVEADYALTLYLRTKHFCGNAENIALLQVDPPSQQDGTPRYAAKDRGVVELDFELGSGAVKL